MSAKYGDDIEPLMSNVILSILGIHRNNWNDKIIEKILKDTDTKQITGNKHYLKLKSNQKINQIKYVSLDNIQIDENLGLVSNNKKSKFCVIF